jgi:hypothetical protein
MVYLASNPDLHTMSGRYFKDMREIQSAPASHDQHLIDQLWELSVNVTGLDASVGEAWTYFRPTPMP